MVSALKILSSSKFCFFSSPGRFVLGFHITSLVILQVTSSFSGSSLGSEEVCSSLATSKESKKTSMALVSTSTGKFSRTLSCRSNNSRYSQPTAVFVEPGRCSFSKFWCKRSCGRFKVRVVLLLLGSIVFLLCYLWRLELVVWLLVVCSFFQESAETFKQRFGIFWNIQL